MSSFCSLLLLSGKEMKKAVFLGEGFCNEVKIGVW